MIAMYVII